MLVETHNILLDVTDPRVLDTALTLVRNDVKANVLHIQLAGVDDWSNVTGIIKYLRSDGLCVIDDVAITNGYADHVVPVAALNVAGEVRCEVALLRDGVRATTNQIIFTVRADIDSDGVRADDRFPVLEKALEQIKSIDSEAILNAEKERGTAEQQRQANEAERQQREIAREKDEQGRKENEEERKSAELKRLESERSREKAEKERADETAGIVARSTVQADKAEEQASKAEANATKSEKGATTATEQANRSEREADKAVQAANRAEAEAERVTVPAAVGVYNTILTDRATGERYALIAEHGSLRLLGVSQDLDATDMRLVDSETGTHYMLVVSNGILAMEEG